MTIWILLTRATKFNESTKHMYHQQTHDFQVALMFVETEINGNIFSFCGTHL